MQTPYPSYKVVIASEDQTRCAHFQIRYMVYCEKKKYEPSNLFPDGYERDAHDAHSLHMLLKYQPPGSQNDRNVGALRLIPGGNRPLPIEHLADLNHRESITDATGELSRLAIHGAPAGHDSLPLFVLCHAAQRHAAACGMSRLYFLARPALARHLTRNHLPLQQAGPPCYHRGKRIPYSLDVYDFAKGLDQWRHKLDNQWLSARGSASTNNPLKKWCETIETKKISV